MKPLEALAHGEHAALQTRGLALWPAVSLALAVVLASARPLAATLPWPPVLPLVVTFHWAVKRPGAMPVCLGFFAGLLTDLLSGGPLGVWSLIHTLVALLGVTGSGYAESSLIAGKSALAGGLIVASMTAAALLALFGAAWPALHEAGAALLLAMAAGCVVPSILGSGRPRPAFTGGPALLTGKRS